LGIKINIFYLDHDTLLCAQYHVDKHVVKMILEHSQILSTAHRVLDGTQGVRESKTGRKQKYWRLDSNLDSVIYQATHINHPSTVWARSSLENYKWLHILTMELCKEYTYRYGKVHKCQSSGLLDALYDAPKNIPMGPFTQPTPAMPDEYKVAGDSVQSYRNYYNGSKQRMFVWKNRDIPFWVMQNAN